MDDLNSTQFAALDPIVAEALIYNTTLENLSGMLLVGFLIFIFYQSIKG